MVTRRDVCPADGGLDCLRRWDVIVFSDAGARRTRHCRFLHGLNLRLNGHERYRCGW
jgi:hypothetical protein